MIDSDWEPARMFFEKHKARVDMGEAEDWNGWSQELDGVIRTFMPLTCAYHIAFSARSRTLGIKSNASPAPPPSGPRPIYSDIVQTRIRPTSNSYLHSSPG